MKIAVEDGFIQIVSYNFRAKENDDYWTFKRNLFSAEAKPIKSNTDGLCLKQNQRTLWTNK
jgi:hypothetical protein